jgi:hypothetical protein
MAHVLNGRHMAEVSELGDEVVVFIVGMRLNKPLKVGRWWPVMTAMPKMLKYLDEHPDKGLLGFQISYLPPFMIQYWRSFQDLERFARDADDPHLEPWRQYNRRVGKSGDVGIWHENVPREDVGHRDRLQQHAAPRACSGLGHGARSARQAFGGGAHGCNR